MKYSHKTPQDELYQWQVEQIRKALEEADKGGVFNTSEEICEIIEKYNNGRALRREERRGGRGRGLTERAANTVSLSGLCKT